MRLRHVAFLTLLVCLTVGNAGVPEDTDNNAVDFIFVDVNGTSAGTGQRLGERRTQSWLC